MTTSRYEYPFDPEKRNNTAASVFRSAREGGRRILDLGSGPGIVAGALSRLADKEVTCVDGVAEHLEAAAERGVHRTVEGDLTAQGWTGQLAGEQFDVIILADVLEHLVDPGDLLARLRDLDLLAPGGFLLISIPNASHIGILASLTMGDFPYRPTGLLDATHLRFFTLTSMQRLLEEHGFGLSRIQRTTRTLEKSEFSDLAARLSRETRATLERQHEETDTYQYVLRVEPLSVARLEALEQQVRRGRRRARKLEARWRRSQELHAEAQQRIGQLEQRLAEVYSSRTWRAGRLLVGGPGSLKRRIRR